MTKRSDIVSGTSCSGGVTLKPPFGFEENNHVEQQEMSLTRAMAMSRIHCPAVPPIPPKVKSHKESTSTSNALRVLSLDEEVRTIIHEYEAHHDTCKNQIWYSQDDFGEMVEDLDEITKRRKRHIAGIRKCYVHTILDLQARHRLEGIQDPKGLACMAKRCTKYSARDAIIRAKELELEVIVSSATSSSFSSSCRSSCSISSRMDCKEQEKEAQEPESGTLDILKSVLGIMGEMDAAGYKKQDTSLRPPMRLVSPRQQD